MAPDHTIPDFPEYYMGVAFAVRRRRANCTGYKVGAAVVVENRVVSTGYNGVPEGMTNCLQGGCDRCANPQRYQSGVGYDVCICVHAEENALLSAARFGIRVDDGTMYTTVRPCFSCMKALHQAGITGVLYHREWKHPDASLHSQYRPSRPSSSAGSSASRGSTLTTPSGCTRRRRSLSSGLAGSGFYQNAARRRSRDDGRTPRWKSQA